MANTPSPPSSPMAGATVPLSPETECRVPSNTVVSVQLTGVAQPLFIGIDPKDVKKIVKRNKFTVSNICAPTLKTAVDYVLKTKDAKVVDKDGYDLVSGLLVAKPYVPGQKEIQWVKDGAVSSDSKSDEEEADSTFLGRIGVAMPRSGLNVNQNPNEGAEATSPDAPLEMEGQSHSVGSIISLGPILGAIPTSSQSLETTQNLENNMGNGVVLPGPAAVHSLLSPTLGAQGSDHPVHQQLNCRPPPHSRYKRNPLCVNPANSRACDYIFVEDDNVVDESLFSDPETYECEVVGWFSGSLPVNNFTLSILQKQWGTGFQCIATESGWHVFKFDSLDAKMKVLQSSPYIVKNRILSLQ